MNREKGIELSDDLDWKRLGGATAPNQGDFSQIDGRKKISKVIAACYSYLALLSIVLLVIAYVRS